MTYSESAYNSLIEDLFARHPSVQNSGFSTGAYKPGLEGMVSFCGSLGHPEREFRSIHVAGTNGKGSVCSFLACALASRGLKVGLYTSPHLLDFRERIKIVRDSSFMLVPKTEVWDFLTQSQLGDHSFFEITTALAFKWFADQKVDIAVIETGLGGRLDSTNVITPQLSIITSIGLDHCALLGDTLPIIASEKAGIFKPGVPALVGEYDSATSVVFESHAMEVNCPLFYADSMMEMPDISRYDLPGPCQGMNARTALSALRILGMEPQSGTLERTASVTGLRGRWETILSNPRVICDIGHNPPALKVNFSRLVTLKPDRLVVVYGIMADKDLQSISHLMPPDATYILCAPSSERSLPVRDLQDFLLRVRPDLDTRIAPSVAEAMKTALEMACGDGGSLVYVGGSTFVVSEAIAALQSFDY